MANAEQYAATWFVSPAATISAPAAAAESVNARASAIAELTAERAATSSE
jgi:hypothetical protein